MSNQPRVTRPARYSGLSPHLVVVDAPAAIDFYVRAFGAKEVLRFALPDTGDIACSELMLEGTMFSVAEEAPQWNALGPVARGGTPVSTTVYVADADAFAARALAAGAKIVFPIQDQFYGFRQGRIEDPFGHQWAITQFQEELSAEEMVARMPK